MRWKAITEATAALRCFAPLVVLWLFALVKGRLGERMGFVSVYLADLQQPLPCSRRAARVSMSIRSSMP